MKTGTLTFHAPNNNGSFLQAYALQYYLINKIGISNEIINYYTYAQEEQYAVFRVPHSIGDIARNAISICHYSGLKRKAYRFECLRSQHLHMTKRYKTENEAGKSLEAYDAIICGSDQIWNVTARDFSDIYLRPKTKKRKIAYAISCGSKLPDNALKKVLTAATGFDYLSVRDEATYEKFKENGLDVVKVLDPTLLLDKSTYETLYNHTPIISGGGYIFLYTINFSDNVLYAANKISRKYGIPVYAPFTGYSAVKCHKYGIHILYDVAPTEFLNLIDNASYIVSNSFHGIVFSVIYEKKFFRPCEYNTGSDDRIDGLLEELNLTEQNLLPGNAIKTPDINYFDVRRKIGELQATSECFLRKALSVY